MVTTDVNPTYIIRAYAWQLLKKNDPGTWDESFYGGLVPIIPLAEEPEFDKYSGPHIVYGYATDSTPVSYYRAGGSTTFAIYDDNFHRLTKTLNILATAFGRYDDTAKDVNTYSSTHPQFLGIRFGYISVGFVEGGTPENEEGGRQSGLINIRYEYYVDYNVTTDVRPG